MATRSLPVRLNHDELRHRQRELIDKMKEIDKFELDEAQRKKEAKEDLESLIAQRDRLREVLDSEQEYREIVIEERPDYARRVVSIVRTDLGEEVDVRAMKESEMQIDAFSGRKVIPMAGGSAGEAAAEEGEPAAD